MSYQVERLAWADPVLGKIPLPRGTMVLRGSFGSGMTRRAGDEPGMVWAIGDRGPNIKVKSAIALYGAEGLEALKGRGGAKLMPSPDIGPSIAQLRVAGDRIELVREIRLTDRDGRAVSGLPVPGGPHLDSEPAFTLDGAPLPPDPGGLDTEGIAALADGGFWIGDEFGPSLVRVDAEGRVLTRLVPETVELPGAPYPVEQRLPPIAAKRQLNRGFEALALSADERCLFLAFQSPLAHPDEAAHEAARHVRLWWLDLGTANVGGQFLYPLDPPESFRRDREAGTFGRDDIKVSELACLPGGDLLVLERGSLTTKIYRVLPDADQALAPEHLDIATRPTVEQLSAADGDFPLPVLAKTLLFSSDEEPAVAADLEGMAILSSRELLLVSDNDFGVEGAETGFWRVRFEEPVLG